MTESHDKTNALLPCPFCSGKAEFGIVGNRDVDDPDFGGHFVHCTQCDACTTLVFPVKDDATRELVERWNKRALPSADSASKSLAVRCRPAVAHYMRTQERAAMSAALSPAAKEAAEKEAAWQGKLLDEIDAILAGSAVPSEPRSIADQIVDEAARDLDRVAAMVATGSSLTEHEARIITRGARMLERLTRSAIEDRNPYKRAWEEWRSLQTGDAQKMMDDALRYRRIRQSPAWYDEHGRKLWGEELDAAVDAALNSTQHGGDHGKT